jgi:hypothetical protein
LLGDEILEAVLTIRLHSSTNTAEMSTRLAKICAELRARQPISPPVRERVREEFVRAIQRLPPVSPQRIPRTEIFLTAVDSKALLASSFLQSRPRIARWSEEGVASRIQEQMPSGWPWCHVSSQPAPMSAGGAEGILSLGERRQSSHAHEVAVSQREAALDQAWAVSLSQPATDVGEPGGLRPGKDKESSQEHDEF